MSEEERRRRNRERARQKARRKKRKMRFITCPVLLLIIAVVGVFAYLTSYIGAVNKEIGRLAGMTIRPPRTVSATHWQKMIPDRKPIPAFPRYIRHRTMQIKQNVYLHLH